MKKLLIILAVSFLPAFLLAQSTPLSSFIDKHSSDHGVVSSEIMPGAMSFDWEKTVDISPVKEILENIDKIRILKYNENEGGQDKLWKKVQKAAADKEYSEIVTLKAEKVNLHMYMMKGDQGKIKEFAILGKGNHGIVMITVTGNMDLSQMFSEENMKKFQEMAEYFMKNKMTCNKDNH